MGFAIQLPRFNVMGKLTFHPSAFAWIIIPPNELLRNRVLLPKKIENIIRYIVIRGVQK